MVVKDEYRPSVHRALRRFSHGHFIPLFLYILSIVRLKLHLRVYCHLSKSYIHGPLNIGSFDGESNDQDRATCGAEENKMF